ncbi:UNKNOWN [Stylonychia lemnae]|uniref:Uncharacterized protein n=1 Tax=Stylonychia lemnae TaxID=5949 RepID=A0A078AEE0_STYLE|nr:UNKNOWN [Stylonychia lemnae]|eukprot:CDW80570.1 UNKNOWN [Stylonychia lemnae]
MCLELNKYQIEEHMVDPCQQFEKRKHCWIKLKFSNSIHLRKKIQISVAKKNPQQTLLTDIIPQQQDDNQSQNSQKVRKPRAPRKPKETVKSEIESQKDNNEIGEENIIDPLNKPEKKATKKQTQKAGQSINNRQQFYVNSHIRLKQLLDENVDQPDKTLIMNIQEKEKSPLKEQECLDNQREEESIGNYHEPSGIAEYEINDNKWKYQRDNKIIDFQFEIQEKIKLLQEQREKEQEIKFQEYMEKQQPIEEIQKKIPDKSSSRASFQQENIMNVELEQLDNLDCILEMPKETKQVHNEQERINIKQDEGYTPVKQILHFQQNSPFYEEQDDNDELLAQQYRQCIQFLEKKNNFQIQENLQQQAIQQKAELLQPEIAEEQISNFSEEKQHLSIRDIKQEEKEAKTKKREKPTKDFNRKTKPKKKKLDVKLKVNIFATQAIVKVQVEDIEDSRDEIIDLEELRQKASGYKLKNEVLEIENKNEYQQPQIDIKIDNEVYSDFDMLSERSEFSNFYAVDAKLNKPQQIYSQQPTAYGGTFGLEFMKKQRIKLRSPIMTPQVKQNTFALDGNIDFIEMQQYLESYGIKIKGLSKTTTIRMYHEMKQYLAQGKLPEFLIS